MMIENFDAIFYYDKDNLMNRLLKKLVSKKEEIKELLLV